MPCLRQTCSYDQRATLESLTEAQSGEEVMAGASVSSTKYGLIPVPKGKKIQDFDYGTMSFDSHMITSGKDSVQIDDWRLKLTIEQTNDALWAKRMGGRQMIKISVTVCVDQNGKYVLCRAVTEANVEISIQVDTVDLSAQQRKFLENGADLPGVWVCWKGEDAYPINLYFADYVEYERRSGHTGCDVVSNLRWVHAEYRPSEDADPMQDIIRYRLKVAVR
jgi:hypothetical protein